MIKDCPLFLLAWMVKQDDEISSVCYEEGCSWWDDEYDCCAILTLARGAHPFKMG